MRVGWSPHRSHKPGASAVRICHPHPNQVHTASNEEASSLDCFLPPWLNWIEHWITNPGVGSSNLSGGTIFVGDWCSGSTGDFESLSTSSILVSPAIYSLCSSKVEHPADNRETLDRYHPQGPVDNIVKMLYNRFFTQEHSMKHAKP